MKIRNLLLATFAAISLATSSCNSDEPEKTDYHVNYTMGVTVNEDLLAVADITVSYIVNDEEKTEAVTSTQWSKTVSYSNFPCKGGMIVKRSFKKDVALDKETYDFKLGYRTVKAVVDQNDNVISEDSRSSGSIESSGISKNRVESYIKTDYTVVQALFTMQAKDGTIAFSPLQ